MCQVTTWNFFPLFLFLFFSFTCVLVHVLFYLLQFAVLIRSYSIDIVNSQSIKLYAFMEDSNK